MKSPGQEIIESSLSFVLLSGDLTLLFRESILCPLLNRNNKPMSRVTTYLNFPRQTEEAFNFYKSIFGGEFTGGIHRFNETSLEADGPVPADDDRNLVMHIELPILGGHVLMGTDAPESMGFRVVSGNNVYINLEPDTREEADRLFTALSAGGVVTMPIADMFWGAYYGSCTDKYGIQWMVNCTAK